MPPKPSFGVRTIAVVLVAAAAFAVVGCGGDDGVPVVIALQPQKDPDRVIAEQERLGAYLSGALSREVEVVVPSSGQVIIQGLKGGTIDVAYLSASNLARNRDAGTLLLAQEIDGKNHYESYWVALAERGYGSVAELEGKPVAFASRTSTSGFVIPLWHLKQRGLIGDDGRPEDFFGDGNVLYGTGYVSAIEKVLSGEAEAAAVSAYVLDGNEHLDEAVRARLAVVDRQGPVPTHVLVARAGLDESTRLGLRQALLGLNADEYRALREALFVGRLAEVDPVAHLADLEPAIAFSERIAE